jgi:Domain of unknown function (DUF5664)
VSYPDNNPKTASGEAKLPIHLVPPALLRGAAEAWANGAAKYGPFNWREHKISSTVYYAACMRHLTDWYDRIDADDCAPDSHVHHLKHAVACLGMLLDTIGSDKLNDNRPLRCPSAPLTGPQCENKKCEVESPVTTGQCGSIQNAEPRWDSSSRSPNHERI